VVVTVTSAADLESAEAVVRRFTPEIHVDAGARQVTARAGGLEDMLTIGRAIDESGIRIDDLGLQRPSLDDVFLHLTGHRAEEPIAEDDASLEEATR
jgi:ABC-2 type transport system ATP-binding protein